MRRLTGGYVRDIELFNARTQLNCLIAAKDIRLADLSLIDSWADYLIRGCCSKYNNEMNCTPKSHLVQWHLKELIIRYGPLSRTWCFQPESSIKVMKKLFRNTNNRDVSRRILTGYMENGRWIANR